MSPLLLGHVGAGSYAPVEIVPLLAVLAVWGLYARRARSLSRLGRPVPLARRASFVAGLALVLVALLSPLDHLGEELVLAHMAQHLLLGDIATLLIALGLTGGMLGPLLRLRVVDRLRPLAHPAAALPLWLANLYVWHLPAIYQRALTSEPLHALQHSSFIGFGLLVWIALLGPLPKPAWFGNLAKLGYVVVMRLAVAVLANVFIWSDVVFYPAYAGGQASWGLAPLADQGIAGVILLIEGSLVTVGVFCWLFFAAAAEVEERQRLLELAAARGLALDGKRAARAVAAGRGAELAERLEAEARAGGTAARASAARSR